MKKARIFVISGPGGVGKTTLTNQLFDESEIKKAFMRAITVTTRDKRPNEKEDKDYFFVEKGEFLWLKKRKFFLEDQMVLDNYYGTPKLFYTLAKNKGKDLILCIDVKGGMYLKKKRKSWEITTIFITAPTEKDLYKRMQKRAEANDLIKERVKLAKKELQFSKYYDYVIINKNIKGTLKKLKGILFDRQ